MAKTLAASDARVKFILGRFADFFADEFSSSTSDAAGPISVQFTIQRKEALSVIDRVLDHPEFAQTLTSFIMGTGSQCIAAVITEDDDRRRAAGVASSAVPVSVADGMATTTTTSSASRFPRCLLVSVTERGVGNGDDNPLGDGASQTSHQTVPLAASFLAKERLIVYCVRPSAGTPISNREQDLVNDISFGSFREAICDDLCGYVQTVVLPVMRAQHEASWGAAPPATVQSFLSYASRFVDSAREAVGRVPLLKDLPPPPPELSRFIVGGGVTAMNTMHRHLDMADLLYETVRTWTAVIVSSAEEPPHVALEGRDDVGPQHEVELWTTRVSRLEALTERLQSRECQIVLTAMRTGATSLARVVPSHPLVGASAEFEKADTLLADGVTLARDNKRYLDTLSGYIESLYTMHPKEVVGIVPPLMASIAMLFQMSRYYRDHRRLTALLVYVTNQLILLCKAAINARGRVWDQAETDEGLAHLLASLQACIALSRAYRAAYDLQRDASMRTAAANGTVAVAPAEHGNHSPLAPERGVVDAKPGVFDFSVLHIFGRFELFVTRITRLIDVFETIGHFNVLSRHNVDRIGAYMDIFKATVDELKSRSTDVLDFTKPTFDVDFMRFSRRVAELESSLQVFINSAFENIPSTANALALLRKFRCILTRPNLRSDLEAKHMVIFHNYTLDLEAIHKQYERDRHSPPQIRNWPPVSSNVAWARLLMRRIEGPIRAFAGNHVINQANNQKELRRVIRSYNRLAQALVQFELAWVHAWEANVATAKLGLRARLLVRDATSGRYFVNFDPDVLQLIAEGQRLTRMGVVVPPTAQSLLVQSSSYLAQKAALADVLRTYEGCLAGLPDYVVRLLAPRSAAFERLLLPGVLTMTWSSMSVSQYNANLQAAAQRLHDFARQLLAIVDDRIDARLAELTALCSVVFGEGPQTLAAFEAMQQRHVAAIAKVAAIKMAEVRSAVAAAVKAVRGEAGWPPGLSPTAAHPAGEAGDVVDCEAAISDFVHHYAARAAAALVKMTVASLDMLRVRLLTPAQSASGAPLSLCGTAADSQCVVTLELTHERGEVAVSPSLAELQQCINQCANAIVAAAASVPSWDIAPSLDFRRHVSGSKDVARPIFLLTGIAERFAPLIADAIVELRRFDTPAADVTDEEAKDDDDEDPYAQKQQKQHQGRVPWSDVVKAGDDSGLQLDVIYEHRLRAARETERNVDKVPSTYVVGPVLLDASELKRSLMRRCVAARQQHLAKLHAAARARLTALSDALAEREGALNTPLTGNLTDMRTIMDTLIDIRGAETVATAEFAPLDAAYALMDRYGLSVPKDETERVTDLRRQWRRLHASAMARNDELAERQAGFKDEFVDQVAKFTDEVKDFRREFEERGPMVRGLSPQETMERLKQFQRHYDAKARKHAELSSGEELFGLEVHTYPDLTKTQKELELLDKLYSLYVNVINKVDGYKDILWAELDFQRMTDEINVYSQQVKRLPSVLKTWPAYDELKAKVDDFLALQPLLEMLSHPAVRERHWKDIMTLTGVTFRLEADAFKLGSIPSNVLDFRTDVEDIALSAVKEQEVEEKKNTISADWQSKEFDFAEFKHRGPIILKGDVVDEIREALEESQLALSAILVSRYVAPFREEVTQLLQKLTAVGETIQLWLEVQSTWMYLEAVFAGGDIMKQLPQEAKRFAQIDKQWSKIMAKAFEQRNVLGFCYKNDVLAPLPHLRDQLEACQRQLTAYLEAKRNLFPRFYFVSDGVLLEILSQSSDPQAIQPHICTVYDGITHIELTRQRVQGQDKRQDLYITSMRSGEGEEVNLTNPVLAHGNVEDWLNKLTNNMMETMRNVLRDAAGTATQLLQSFSRDGLRQMIKTYPSQIALLVLQILWTADVTLALSAPRSDQRKQIMETGKRIGTIKGDLTEITKEPLDARTRTNVETLITIQVHQVDVWEQSVIQQRLRDVTSFEWQKQARFYWKKESSTCIVQIADSETEYCYEYLGVKERLVITPLTDRCYITLSQALSMFLGGAPAGPAGTGKTETVKDLGRTLGKYVVVFNCSDQLDFRAMGKIFKGLCQSGAWGCFDEFNRIDLPVLSVVAQQVATIFAAMKQHKNEFVFTDGQMVKLIPTTGFFITMNPGYAGRQELPENLKVLFRSVSMMVPDRRAIMRVKLAAQGYTHDVLLAKKFFLLYQLCEQQLSKQRHYDFGLRNILSVLRTAGSVLREQSEKNAKIDEEAIFMRILRDMNLSKLVFDDITLFNSLIADLFPGKTADKGKNDKFEAALRKQCTKSGLQYHPPWALKVQQLYETKLVRHGLMLVGPAGVGKSAVYSTLLKLLPDIGEPVHKESRMNPKAITAPQMFGRLDGTGDWHDGVFSFLWRKANKDKQRNVWIICDGPVDAIWIENLNTVLDDNKLLTLANGDRIPMAASVRCCFEVENLNNASPATVSRAGIIYVSSAEMSWEPPMTSLIYRDKDDTGKSSLPVLPKDVADTVMAVLRDQVPAIQEMLRVRVKSLMPCPDVHVVRNAVTVITQMYVLAAKAAGVGTRLPTKTVEAIAVFGLAWGYGGFLDESGRERLHALLQPAIPAWHGDGTVFDYALNFETGGACQWRSWNDEVKPWSMPKDFRPAEFPSLFIPTMDSVRSMFLMQLVWSARVPCLLTGVSGAAKTVTVETFLDNAPKLPLPDMERFTWKKMNFSAAHTPGLFQMALEDMLDKRMGTTYGPKRNRFMTLFIDDMHQPEYNEWGDQVTSEIVRQVVEMKGLFSLDRMGEWKWLSDISYIAGMGRPGPSINDVPNRLRRHFFVLNFSLPNPTSISQVYGTILQQNFAVRNFSASVRDLAPTVTAASMALWQKMQTKMLPTPSKVHYLWNLRDLSRITQGILLCPPEVIDEALHVAQLWQHEVTRVLGDKLNSVQDKQWFDTAVDDVMQAHFGHQLAAAVKDSPQYFVNFMREPVLDPDTGEQLEAAPVIYEPAASLQHLRDKLDSGMRQHNESKASKKLDLVLFDMAVKQIVRISRILSLSRGHAMLVGVGGSGKQSLTRLAAFVCGCACAQISVHKQYGMTQFLEDVRTQYVGVLRQPIAFLFTDTELKNESFLQAINSILSSGELPGLFDNDARDSVRDEVRAMLKRDKVKGFVDSEDYLWRYFIDRVRSDLHFVLCFSPVGAKFAERARKYPAIFGECSINWFFPWPLDALRTVASRFLSSFSMQADPAVRSAIVSVMAEHHDAMANVATEYFQRHRRSVAATPKNFLSFVESFMTMYETKHADLNSLSSKLNVGLSKLQEAAEAVRDMRVTLAEKERRLQDATAETDALVADIEVATDAAKIKQTDVQGTKDILSQNAAVVSAQKEDAVRDLALAKPALEEAKAALNAITQADINSVKAYSNPPELIKRIMDGVMVMLGWPIEQGGIAMVMVKGKPMMKDMWANFGKPLISRMDFMQMLDKFNDGGKDAITEETCELTLPFLEMEDWSYARASKAASSIAGLCEWVRAMYSYHNIAKVVEPKLVRLREMEDQLNTAQSKLREKEEELEVVNMELLRQQTKLDAAKAKKKDLQDDAERTRRRMSSATALIDALGGERERWTEQAAEFVSLTKRLVGDVTVACAFINYAGPFNADFRKRIVSDVRAACAKARVPLTDALDVIRFTSNPETVTDWQIQGLPYDDHSIQNAIMMQPPPPKDGESATVFTGSYKFPLVSDPQGQCLAWLKNKEEANGLVVTTFSHPRFLDHLRDQLREGLPLVIENVEEEIEPVLDPLLEKRIVRQGRRLMLMINDKPFEFSKEFRMFLITRLPNPSYAPEVFAKCNVIDFTVTMDGLEQQLLGRVIRLERNELENERLKLVEEVNENEKRLKMYEDRLLAQLSNSKGNLIDDDDLVTTLAEAKTAAAEIKDMLTTAVENRKRINAAREEYRPVAIRGSVIYFVLMELRGVNHMYQISLARFLSLFDNAILTSEPSQLLSRRIATMTEAITLASWSYFERGLFVEHKSLFSLLLAAKIQLRGRTITPSLMHGFLQGGSALTMADVRAKPFGWVADRQWLNLVAVSECSAALRAVPDSIQRNESGWRTWLDNEAPEAVPLPDGLDARLSPFERMTLVRALRRDRVMLAARIYIEDILGKRYNEMRPLDVQSIVDESGPKTPMVFLLSQGGDPTGMIEALAKRTKTKLHAISMGQGQEPAAHAYVQTALAQGQWVLLQNCHLGLPFLHQLEQVVQKLNEDRSEERRTTDDEPDPKGGKTAPKEEPVGPSRDARIFITSEPTNAFPIGLLQLSVKITNEPPQGMQAGLMRCYSWLQQDFLEAFRRAEWAPLVYVICFIHSLVVERRRFGAIGWNVPYEFNQGDWLASVQFFQNHFTQLGDDARKAAISWDTIQYMVGEIQYGGRITDDKDRLLFNAICSRFLNGRMAPGYALQPGYNIATTCDEITKVRAHIDTLPEVDTPVVFGLNANADITYRTLQANAVLQTIQQVQPRESSAQAGPSREDAVQKLATDLLKKVPQEWHYESVIHPNLKRLQLSMPLTTFLGQEVDRLRKVITTVKQNLNELLLAIAGTIVMSPILRDILDSLHSAQPPANWIKISWKSPTLGAWMLILNRRYDQLNSWLTGDRPPKYWLAGFFNPQGFLTSVQQEVTRAHAKDMWALDEVEMRTEVLKADRAGDERAPAEGVHIYGLFLEGASWDRTNRRLRESAPKELLRELPLVHVTAAPISKGGRAKAYRCPVYIYPNRTDQNWVFDVELPTDEDPDHWTIRGAACLLATE